MELTLQLFGTPQLLQGDAGISLERRKAMALLSYLAVTESRHHRDMLVALLWPESNAAAASQALRNVLWTIRQTPLADAIQSDRTSIALAAEAVAVDVIRFRRLMFDCPSRSHEPSDVCHACEPLLEEAVSLYRGTFMSGFSVLNTVRFEDWQLAESEALRRESSELLDRLVAYYLRVENWRAAARYARRWLQADSLNEVGYRRLMQALSAQGKRGEALQVFDECRRMLSQELGLSPEDSTADLALSIRAKRDAAVRICQKPSRLPNTRTPIIGRDEAAKRIESLLLDEATRVVSLVGQGGSGKTSLALYVGRRIEDRFSGGAVYVQLDTKPDSSSLATAVGNALELTLAGEMGIDQDARLAELLEERELLLILDGVDEFAPQVSALARTLETAHSVRILLTSRVSMDIEDEVLIRVSGLACPDEDIPPDGIADFAAVRLLQVSAERYGIALHPDLNELRGMARLARLLEGSPLGLEMAAGWRSLLEWNAIADRVSDNLEFLVHRCEDVSPRHRTLSVVFEQSWQSLPLEAQQSLQRLSVFRGRFTITAAEKVARSNPSTLAMLVNRCLLKRTGSQHYEMHELLRQFAQRRLHQDNDDSAMTRSLHIQYYARAVAQWLERLKGPEQIAALAQMEQEMENVHVAFLAAAADGDTDHLRELCEGLYSYYDMRTLLTEATAVFSEALMAYREHPDRDSVVEAFLSIAAGYFVSWDRPSLGRQRMAEGVKLLPLGPPQDRLHAMANLICGWIALCEDRDASQDTVAETIAFYREHEDPWGEAIALTASAMLERRHDNLDLANSPAEHSLRLHREHGNKWGEGIVMHLLARLDDLSGNLELALARYEEALRLLEPFTRDGFDVLSSLILQARVNGQLGRDETRMQLAERALYLARKAGYRFQIARALNEMAGAARSLGDPESARLYLEEAIDLLRHRQWHDLQVTNSLLLADLALDTGDLGSAEQWLREAFMLEPENAGIVPLSERLSNLQEQRAERSESSVRSSDDGTSKPAD